MEIGKVLETLYQIIKERKDKLPEGSYTAELFRKGEDRILQKLGEEAIEAILALKSGSKEDAVYEVSDLLYHLLVALANSDIGLDEVANELKRRMK